MGEILSNLVPFGAFLLTIILALAAQAATFKAIGKAQGYEEGLAQGYEAGFARGYEYARPGLKWGPYPSPSNPYKSNK